MKESIIIEIAKLIINHSLKKMTKNQKILTILNKVNKLTLKKDDFESIFIHTLVEYGVDKPDKDLVNFFSSPLISDAIKQEKHTKDLKGFKETCKFVFDDFQGLENFTKFDAITDEINEFIITYDSLVETSANPIILKMYNLQKEDSFKQTFEYQSEKYLKYLIQDFDVSFPQNKYIQQKGEMRETVINLLMRPSIGKIKKRTKLSKRKRESENKTNSFSKILDFKDVIVSPLEPIDKYINDWLNDDSQNFLAIMGEYGTGKTALCKHIAKELALSYSDKKTNIIDDKHNRIVILLNLRSFKTEEVEKFINAELTEFGIKDFDTTALYKRIDNRELIFIFDGFDEMTQKIDTEEKKANFLQIEKLIRERKNSKVVLTSREEYFTFDEELNEVFNNIENENYKIIYLNLFDDDQIRAYLETHTDNAQFYLDKIKEIYDLSDLAPRPVLLDFIVKYLPKLIEEKGEDITINASDLYYTGIKTELEKKSREVSFLNKKLPTQKRLLLLQKLSVWMYENDTLIIDTRIIKEKLNLEKFFKVREDYEVIKYLNMFLNFTFLMKESDYIFRISHRSFRDYLIATELVKEINSGKINIFSKHQTSSEINLFISEMKPNRKKLEQMVTEKVETTEHNKWQKSNAVNIILKMDNHEYNKSIDFNANEINLNNSKLLNISILHELKKLTELDLTLNQISNLEPLKELKNLYSLDLVANNICNIKPLQELNNLLNLSLGGNIISNLEPLKELKKLSYLNLSGRYIRDIEPLKELKNLTSINLSGNQIKDIKPLLELRNLKHLYLSAMNINDVKFLKNFNNLEILSLIINQIDDIEPLKELNKLTYLYLEKNHIKNIVPLKELNKLHSLKLSSNQISNIEPLKELNKLHILKLSSNQISNIEPLKGLKKLTYLYLEKNRIKDIEPLKELKNLTSLNLSGNQINDIVSLKEFNNFIELDLSENPLNISQIRELRKALPTTNVIFDLDSQDQ